MGNADMLELTLDIRNTAAIVIAKDVAKSDEQRILKASFIK